MCPHLGDLPKYPIDSIRSIIRTVCAPHLLLIEDVLQGRSCAILSMTVSNAMLWPTYQVNPCIDLVQLMLPSLQLYRCFHLFDSIRLIASYLSISSNLASGINRILVFTSISRLPICSEDAIEYAPHLSSVSNDAPHHQPNEIIKDPTDAMSVRSIRWSVLSICSAVSDTRIRWSIDPINPIQLIPSIDLIRRGFRQINSSILSDLSNDR